MTAFLIGAVLLTATAMAFVLTPLLRREGGDTSQVERAELNLAVLRDQLRELDADLAAGEIQPLAYESARHELERRVAEEVQPQAAPGSQRGDRRRTAIAVGIALPMLAVALYMLMGTPAALDPQQAVANKNTHEVTPEQIEGMVTALAQRLKNQPDDVDGWSMLARSYNALGRYAQASDAFEHLVKLIPNDAGLYADYADTLAMAMNRSLQGEPEKLIDRALAIDPKNIKALALGGSAAFERRDYAAAIERWQRILPLVAPDSDIARSTTGSIGEAQSLMGQGTRTAQREEQKSAPAASGPTLEGIVDIDPAMRAQAADTDTIFIFARAAQGPRFPLAVLRKQVKDLPVKFTLDDSMGMMPNVKLSDFPMVVVGARVSKTGSATPAPGDLEGVIDPVAPGAKDLKIRISKRNG
jgi:cytochrome c-type biogenesis protein CcmH